MCRLMACSENMKKGDILDILLDMETRNTDGFGFSYVENGKFVLYKTKNSLSDSLKKKNKDNIFNFFPERRKGWAILHLRAATHGNVSARNSHPFLSENYAFVHNGVFHEQALIKTLLGKSIKYESDTDSEVALHLFEKIGPKRFSKLVGGMSVYLALCRNGGLWAVKTAFAADLKIAQLYKKNKKKVFLSSELPFKTEFEADEAKEGWFYFSPNGELQDYKIKDFEDSNSYNKPQKKKSFNFGGNSMMGYSNLIKPGTDSIKTIHEYLSHGAGHFD